MPEQINPIYRATHDHGMAWVFLIEGSIFILQKKLSYHTITSISNLQEKFFAACSCLTLTRYFVPWCVLNRQLFLGSGGWINPLLNTSLLWNCIYDVLKWKFSRFLRKSNRCYQIISDALGRQNSSLLRSILRRVSYYMKMWDLKNTSLLSNSKPYVDMQTFPVETGLGSSLSVGFLAVLKNPNIQKNFFSLWHRSPSLFSETF